MSVITYHQRAASTTANRPLKGLGTKHAGTKWTNAVRSVSAALYAAREHTPDQVPTGEQIAEILIDLADSLTIQDRALLASVVGDLARWSRRDRKNGKAPSLFPELYEKN
jgi:hypothetical protein